MERQLWKAIVGVMLTIDKPRKKTIEDFSDEMIAKVYYWSVIHDRSMSWACRRGSWPLDLRRQTLPSATTMSRRLQSASVKRLLDQISDRVTKPQQPGVFWMIDGKSLPIGGASKDKQAGYGRAARCKAKGYKMHAIVSSNGSVAAMRIAPMNKDERTMARRMVRTAEIQGYLIADSNYDSNPLHDECMKRDDLQLVTPRRYGPKHGLAHGRHSPSRLRSIALTENPNPEFGEQLLHDRNAIERKFAHTTNWAGGLQGLPSWVRTHRRVFRWVQAKLVLTALKRQTQFTTYVA
jgi:Transposase DDE domain